MRKFLVKRFYLDFEKYVNFNGVLIPVRNISFHFGTKLILNFSNYELRENFAGSSFREAMNVIEIGTYILTSAGIISPEIGSKGKLISRYNPPKKKSRSY